MEKKDLEHKTDEASKTTGGSILISTVKKLFGSDTNYGIYHRNGWGFLALAYTTNYYIHPVIAFPIFAVAGYNFIQAFRHKYELFK